MKHVRKNKTRNKKEVPAENKNGECFFQELSITSIKGNSYLYENIEFTL